jgi:hypothetical protein
MTASRRWTFRLLDERFLATAAQRAASCGQRRRSLQQPDGRHPHTDPGEEAARCPKPARSGSTPTAAAMWQHLASALRGQSRKK